MKKYSVCFLSILTILTQIGCKKQLDALPKDALVEGNTIVDQQTATTALRGVYYRFAFATDVATNWLPNELNGNILAGLMADGRNTTNDETNKLGSTSMNSEWGREYTLINAANGVLSGVSKLGDDKFADGRKQQMLAEAAFLRAYAHFKLLSWFGQWYDVNSKYGVILRKDFITSTNYPQARDNVKNSYDFILQDVDQAINNAAATSQNVYVNKWSAMALKMRVLLQRGQGDDYTQCAALGAKIISEGPYVLESNPKDIFYTKGLLSNEVMLAVQPQANQGSYYYNTSGNYLSTRSSYYVATDNVKNMLNNDPRQSWMIGPKGKYNKGWYFIKYVQASQTTTQLSEVAYAIRLSEVYLMQAEAILRAGGDIAVAKTLIKTVMAKAGITDFSVIDNTTDTQELLKQTYYEYVKNFVGEDGTPYWALLRFPLETVTQLRPTITSKDQYILPIPHDEFVNNPLIGDQNPSYKP
jgi:hypothetical protein